MIEISHEFVVKNVERKTVKKKDGGDFTFIEAKLTTDEQKPTTIVARLTDEIATDIVVGKKYLFKIVVTSWEKDGRVWNNFVAGNKFAVEAPKPTVPFETDILPF